MTNNLGLYIHVPFCGSKCNYCDFYSFAADNDTIDLYTLKVQEEIKRWGVRVVRPIDSLYFGGGTPSLLGGRNIANIIGAVRDSFSFGTDAEITLEANPADNLKETLSIAAAAGVNRLSLGVQSGNEDELKVLGRRHKNSDVFRTVTDAKNAGIKNISMDLMIGLPHSNVNTVKQSLDFILNFDPQHVSVYMLKIEKDTSFYKNTPPLVGEDAETEQYLFVSEYLRQRGYEHYEISNFAKPGFESRHNNKYWNCDEYIGIGPSAHSFLSGRRFYYERDINAFLSGAPVIDDGVGGDSDEYIMLRLRLKDGLSFSDYNSRYGVFPDDKLEKAERLEKLGLLSLTEQGIALTQKGFLLSNAVVGELI